MKEKDIKSKTTDVKPMEIPVETKHWKSRMRFLVNLGTKINPLNEEQTEYLKKCETDKADKEAKAKLREEAKQAMLKKMSDALKAKKAQILTAANDLADRIIIRTIEREEQEKKFEAIDKKNKEKVKKDKMEAAKIKRERKAELRNKTILSPEAIERNKQQQDFLAKAHAEKRELIEARLNKKEEFMAQTAEEYEKKRQARIKRNKTLALKRLHRDETKEKNRRKIEIKRTTKAERIEAIKQKKEAGRAAFNAEMKRQASEIAADRRGYALRQEKRLKTEVERLARIAERRKLRKDKVFANKLKQQKIQQMNLERFKLSEEARLARKQEHRAKYLIVGGIKSPKVKNKIPLDKERADQYVKDAEKKLIDDKVRYIIRIASTTASEIVSDSVQAFTCKPEELPKRMKQAHENSLKSDPDTYIGIYAYSGIGKDQKCVYEMLNDKFKDRSRINDKTEAA